MIKNIDLREISAFSFEEYLASKGWERDVNFKNKNLMVFSNKKNRIALPSSEKFDDFYVSAEQILHTLALIERRDERDIAKDIISMFYDRLEFSIRSPLSEDGKLPLEYAARCIEGLKELILYSACAVQNAQPVCPKATNAAKEYLDSFKLAQTEIGSFVIKIDLMVIDEHDMQTQMPITPFEVPIEHKIVERIDVAMNQINDAVKHNHKLSQLTENAYETGVTANMCDALLKLKPDALESTIKTTVRHASVLTGATHRDTQVVFEDRHFWVIEEISNIYKNQSILRDVTLTGAVRTLEKKGSDDATERIFKLSTIYEGKQRVVSMELFDEGFRKACNALRDGDEVEVSGELDMSTSRSWRLNKVNSFRIIPK